MAGSILIVDDAATVRTLIELKLRSALPAFDYRQCGNGLAAIEEMVARPPSAVVLDVNMPVLDGTGVLVVMRRAAELAPAELRDRLDGGAAARGLAIAGFDPATFKMTDPFHPRRGCYEDLDLDGHVEQLMAVMEQVYGADLDRAPDGLALTSIPRYLIGEVLGRPALRAIPLVLLTTLASGDQRARFTRLGPPDAYLSKPFDAAHAGRLIKELTARM